jgi:GNAT superfamily N-acetyltransferase
MINIKGPGLFFLNHPNKRANALNLVTGRNLGKGYASTVFGLVGKGPYKNYVVLSNNKIHGFAVIRGNGKNLHVMTIATTQKKGIGRLLMNRIKNDAKKVGYKTLRVNSGPTAVNFYKKMGFNVTNTNTNNTFAMKKVLE